MFNMTRETDGFEGPGLEQGVAERGQESVEATMIAGCGRLLPARRPEKVYLPSRHLSRAVRLFRAA